MSAETPEPSDEVLVERTLAGDTAAFDLLVKRHIRRVLSVAAGFFRQPEAREDIGQETFLKAFQSLDTYHRGASFERWLTRIAVNACYDQLRRVKRKGELLLSDLAEDESAWLDGALSSHSMERFEAGQRRDQARELADRLLAHLSSADRMAMLLMDRDGYSAAEIGEMLGWSRSNVKVRIFRARRLLKNRLKQLSHRGVRRK